MTLCNRNPENSTDLHIGNKCNSMRNFHMLNSPILSSSLSYQCIYQMGGSFMDLFQLSISFFLIYTLIEFLDNDCVCLVLFVQKNSVKQRKRKKKMETGGQRELFLLLYSLDFFTDCNALSLSSFLYVFHSPLLSFSLNL